MPVPILPRALDLLRLPKRSTPIHSASPAFYINPVPVAARFRLSNLCSHDSAGPAAILALAPLGQKNRLHV